MNILILGCGYIGPATAHYLLKHPEVRQVTLADTNEAQLIKAKEQLMILPEYSKLEVKKLDITEQSTLDTIMKRHQIVAAALPWPATLLALSSAIKMSKPFVSITRPHYTDVFSLMTSLKDKSPPIMLGCGLEPGLTEIAARHALDHLSKVEKLELRCGGIPQHPQPPLNYKAVFNSTGLPIEPRTAYTIENGILATVPRFSGVELINIDQVGQLEAWHDGMLPWLIDLNPLKQAKTVTQKTLRWPGFAAIVQLLSQLGFLSETPIFIKDRQIIPKQVSNAILSPHAQFAAKDRDVSILQVEAHGVRNHTKVRYQSTLIDYYDETHHLTAMARTTGFTLGIITTLIASGELKGYGLLRPEAVFTGENYKKLISALSNVGISFKTSIHTLNLAEAKSLPHVRF